MKQTSLFKTPAGLIQVEYDEEIFFQAVFTDEGKETALLIH